MLKSENKNKHSDLVPIKGRPHYFRNPVSGNIYWRKSVKGRPIKKSTGTDKITVAERIIDDFLLSLNAENIIAAKRKKRGEKNPTIKSIWDECLSLRKASRSDSTKVRWQTAWDNDLAPFWGNKHISDLKQESVAAFEVWFIENRKDKQFFSSHKYLGMLINFAFKKRYINERYAITNLDKVVAGRAKKKTHFRVLDFDEKCVLIDHAVNMRTKVALLGYQDTGARKMEILSSLKEKIDFKENVIWLWSSKNKEWRKVWLTKRFKRALLQWIEHSPSSKYLFPAPRDPKGHIASQVFDKDWIATKKAAGIRGRCRVHDLRHTFADQTARDKWAVKDACDVLDMTAQVYLDTYCHSDWAQIVKSHQGSFDV
jgi:integrase